VGRTLAGAVREELQPMGRTHVGEVYGELSPARGTFKLEQRKSVRSLSSEEEGATETVCDELTIIPIPHPPALLGAGGGRETGVKLSPGRRGGVGGKVF